MEPNDIQKIVEGLDLSGNKRLESLKKKIMKKMSVKSSSDLTNLMDLFYWLFIYDYEQELISLFPVGFSLKFTGNWNLWSPCEGISSLLYYLSDKAPEPEASKKEALEKIESAYETMDIPKERCDGLLLENRRENVELAILSNSKSSVRDALYLELLEFVEIYAFGGSEKYPLEQIEKRVSEIKDQLKGMNPL